jgi:hypothetical protein
MDREQRNKLLYKLIAIDRWNQSGKRDLANRETLRILMNLIVEVYEMQNKT